MRHYFLPVLWRNKKLLLFFSCFSIISFSLFAGHPRNFISVSYQSTAFSPDIFQRVIFNEEKNFSIINPESSAAFNNESEKEEDTGSAEKILVVLSDVYGSQKYSKIIITDVDMMESILIAKDIFNRIPPGLYTVIASSANDLVSNKLIIQ